MAELLKGMEVVNAMKQRLIDKNKELAAKGVTPCLNIVRIGERPDDLSYERGALKRFESLGVKTRVSAFSEDVSRADFEAAFKEINRDKSVHGILLFRPMPGHIDEEAVKRLLDPEKDMDGMCRENIAKVFAGDESGYAPCTPVAVMALLKHFNIEVKGKNVTLIGRSMVVGKPLAMLLLKEHATVTVCHTRTRDLAAECRRADIVVAAAGAANMIKANHIRRGAVVIDVGINVGEDGTIRGDANFAAVAPLAAKMTPVPGGVGAVTASVLAEHVLNAAEKTIL